MINPLVPPASGNTVLFLFGWLYKFQKRCVVNIFLLYGHSGYCDEEAGFREVSNIRAKIPLNYFRGKCL